MADPRKAASEETTQCSRLLCTLITALAAGTPFQAPGDQVDAYVRQQMKRRRMPGLSLAVVRHGKVVKAQGYGLASLELPVPATPETVYEIGSGVSDARRKTVASHLKDQTAFVFVGEERRTPDHWVLAPGVTRIRRYRMIAGSKTVYYTFQLTETGEVAQFSVAEDP